MKKHNENYLIQKRLLRDKSTASAKVDPLIDLMMHKKARNNIDFEGPYGIGKYRNSSAAVSETERNEEKSSKLLP